MLARCLRGATAAGAASASRILLGGGMLGMHAAAGHAAAAAQTAVTAASEAARGVRSVSTASAAGGGSELHVVVDPQAEPYEGVSIVSLCRPSSRNAIGRQLLSELAEAINTLRQERTTRCVVLRSAVPGVFCAGADLKERARMTQHEVSEFVSALRRTFCELQAMPIPTLAVVDGPALGGGAELALACDVRVIGPGAVFAFPEAQLGVIPGAGGTQRLPRAIGQARAKELIFTGRRVDAAEALRLGLAEHAVTEGSALEKALQLAKAISRSAPLSLRMAKEAINQGANVDLATGMRLEEAYYAQLLHTKDRREGLAAFAERREPCYMGE